MVNDFLSKYGKFNCFTDYKKMISEVKPDAVFVAVGKPRFITANMIKPGSAIIDIGINQIEENGKMITVGDVDYASCSELAGWITPVPGGVGPVTVSILMRNTATALKAQVKFYEETFDSKSDKLVHVEPMRG